MAESDSRNLQEEWRAFLQRDVDAQAVVHGVMERTGFRKGEVLFYLMEAWAEQNSTREQGWQFDRWVDNAMSKN